MKKLIKNLAYVWAAAALPIVLATFFYGDFFAKKLVASTGLKVSPIYTGGETAKTIKHEGYVTMIHRPVFDGLFCERKNGFVQINWKAEGEKLPESIDEEIDFDSDGKIDFKIKLNTATNNCQMESYNSEAVSCGKVLDLKNERLVRISLKKE